MLKKEQFDAIFEGLTLGLTITDTCVHAGINPQTYYDYYNGDEEFRKKADKARLSSKIRNISLVQKAGQDGQWQASAWWLERKHKNEFALRQEMTGADGEKLQVNFIVPNAGIVADTEKQ